jgi:hypothetical protein
MLSMLKKWNLLGTYNKGEWKWKKGFSTARQGLVRKYTNAWDRMPHIATERDTGRHITTRLLNQPTKNVCARNVFQMEL